MKARQEADNERVRRERERKEFKAAQELESLRRAFKRMDKKSDNTIDVDELMAELEYLGHSVKPTEAALTIWEVDDDADGRVNWEEFKTMFYRIRDDTTGYEPRKLFNVVEFLMLDKNANGSVDLDECLSVLYSRYGKAAVDEAANSVLQEDELNDKNIHFSTFATIQRKSAKLRNSTGLKPDAVMVPQVKGLSYVSDPALKHLL